jgi:divalent metal cation (Fe/Co/Zn/Cd) transporter
VGSPSPDPGQGVERTLLIALLLSMWAPLTTGVAVLMSESVTQVADFVRRSVELVALAVSWGVVRYVRRHPDLGMERVARLERIAAWTVVGALTASALVTIVLAATRHRGFDPGGDVRLGLLVAALGLVTNAVFLRRYGRLGRRLRSTLVMAQRRLYGAKVMVDAGVIAALATVWIAPRHPVARPVDLAGSVVVALYLLLAAVRTARGASGSVGASGRAVQ